MLDLLGTSDESFLQELNSIFDTLIFLNYFAEEKLIIA